MNSAPAADDPAPFGQTSPAADPFLAAKQNREALFPKLRNPALVRAEKALAEGATETARPLLAKFLGRHPDSADALHLQAELSRQSDDFAEAERLFTRCVELSPSSAGYRFNYGVLLRRLNKYEQALEQFEILRRQIGPHPAIRDQTAALLRLMGRYDDALACRRELVEEYPASSEAWLHYAHALRAVGATDLCVSAYRKALELAPTPNKVYVHLANLKTYHFTADEVGAMEKSVALPGLDAADRAPLLFSLGKAYGAAAEYAKSFACYAKGNASRRAGVEFDPERLTAHRTNCETLFTAKFFRDRTGWGHDSQAPIFIVGMPRSGSTLVEQILSSHSAVEALGEVAELDNVIGDRLSVMYGRPPHHFWIGGWFEFRRGLIEVLPDALARMKQGDLYAIAEAYLAAVAPRRTTGCPLFTDKALRNFGYVGLIHLMFPRAKIIDARRHPLDCGWSCFKSDFPGGQPFATRLGDIGRHYANYARLMAHFDRVLPGRVHRLSYEDLIADPETAIRCLLDYCGLPFEDQCLRFHENKRPVATLSSEQVRLPLYKTAVPEWESYEPWLRPLKETLGRVPF